jgi:hypothetical protein
MRESIYLSPPQDVVKAAKKGLALREKFGRGSTYIGISLAKEIVQGHDLEPRTIMRMSSYFARHAVDKKAKNFGNDANPSKGYIAWLLWGGDVGQKWADEIKKKLVQSSFDKAI